MTAKPSAAQTQTIRYFNGMTTPGERVRVTEATYDVCVREGWIEKIEEFPYHRTLQAGADAIGVPLRATAPDLSALTPVQIDTILERLYHEGAAADQAVDSRMHSLHSANGERAAYRGHRPLWPNHDATTLAECEANPDRPVRGRSGSYTVAVALAEYRQAVAARQAIADQQAPYDDEYARRPWTRYFRTQGSDSHIHESMHCSTCNRGGQRTAFGWNVALSGQPVEVAIAALKTVMCTVCFPGAPTVPAQPDTSCKGKVVGKIRRYGMGVYGTCECGADVRVNQGGYPRKHKPAKPAEQTPAPAAAPAAPVVEAITATAAAVEDRRTDMYDAIGAAIADLSTGMIPAGTDPHTVGALEDAGMVFNGRPTNRGLELFRAERGEAATRAAALEPMTAQPEQQHAAQDDQGEAPPVDGDQPSPTSERLTTGAPLDELYSPSGVEPARAVHLQRFIGGVYCGDEQGEVTQIRAHSTCQDCNEALKREQLERRELEDRENERRELEAEQAVRPAVEAVAAAIDRDARATVAGIVGPVDVDPGHDVDAKGAGALSGCTRCASITRWVPTPGDGPTAGYWVHVSDEQAIAEYPGAVWTDILPGEGATGTGIGRAGTQLEIEGVRYDVPDRVEHGGVVAPARLSVAIRDAGYEPGHPEGYYDSLHPGAGRIMVRRRGADLVGDEQALGDAARADDVLGDVLAAAGDEPATASTPAPRRPLDARLLADGALAGGAVMDLVERYGRISVIAGNPRRGEQDIKAARRIAGVLLDEIRGAVAELVAAAAAARASAVVHVTRILPRDSAGNWAWDCDGCTEEGTGYAGADDVIEAAAAHAPLAADSLRPDDTPRVALARVGEARARIEEALEVAGRHGLTGEEIMADLGDLVERLPMALGDLLTQMYQESVIVADGLPASERVRFYPTGVRCVDCEGDGRNCLSHRTYEQRTRAGW